LSFRISKCKACWQLKNCTCALPKNLMHSKLHTAAERSPMNSPNMFLQWPSWNLELQTQRPRLVHLPVISSFLVPSSSKLCNYRDECYTKGSEHERMIPHDTDWKPWEHQHSNSTTKLQCSILHHLSISQNQNVESEAAWEPLEKQELVRLCRLYPITGSNIPVPQIGKGEDSTHLRNLVVKFHLKDLWSFPALICLHWSWPLS
jgi:hypothetical protein